MKNTDTKDEFTVYMSEKLLDYGKNHNIPIVVVYRDIRESSLCDT